MTENFTIPDVNTSDFDPFAGPAIERVAPATEPQLEIWLACLLGGENATRSYNLSSSLRLEGPFNRSAMELALQALVRRHDALRSVFSANGEHLFILKEINVPITYQDLCTTTPDKQTQLIAHYVARDALKVVNLAEGPLFNVGLFKLAGQVHHLVLTSHHIVRDGWSMGVMLQDLSVLYSSYAQGLTPSLPAAPSFAQYAEEQRYFSKTDTYRATEEFWLGTYKDNIPLLELPTDYPRPAVHTFDSKRLDYPMDSTLMTAVKKMGLKAGCSFVTTLLATFEVLLHRLSGQEDIIVGLPTAGQSATGNKRLVGHCVNLLPIRSYLDANLPFSDFLTGCKRTVLDAHEYQRLTFSQLLRKLNVVRDQSRTPFVSAVFNVDLGMNDGVNFHGLNHHLISHPKDYENFELFFNASGSENALTLEWAYNTNLFKAETIERMMTDFENLLKTVVETPSILIRDIVFTSERKLFQTLAQQLPAKTVYPRQTPVHQLIAQAAAANPANIALSFNDQAISYQSLNETANQLAHVLIQKGIKAGQVIGIALDRSPEMLITLLAVLKTGAAYLPLDPDYPTDRLTFMLADSAATILITQAKHQGRLSTPVAEVLVEQALIESVVYSVDEPDRFVSGDDLAYVLYTSGSTGKPKGVLIEHHSLVNFLWSMLGAPGIKSDDVLLAITTISFDIAGLELYLPLVAGATVLMADTDTARDGRALVELINTKRVSIMQATPSTWRMMLDAGWNTFLPLKALCGGEALPQDLAEKLTDRCHEVWNLYGPTETTIWSTVKKIARNELVTIGQPINNTQVYILDKFLRPVVTEAVGELFIGGEGVARGYLNRQDLTAERFVRLSFDKQPDRLLYRTGDLGKRLKNGEIQCLGRVDQQVKIRGHRIELGEIDNALVAIGDVKEAVVVAQEDRPGEQRLIAYVVPDSISPTDSVSWQERWNAIYATGMSVAEQTGNQKDVKSELKDWAHQSIKRIRHLQPKRVLEVGCGDGQLLLELAPDVSQYIATDYAQAAINKLQPILATDPDRWRHVTASVASADDFSMIPDASLDLVIIHSVAQYFPDADYLQRVIERAVNALVPGGCIFIGDMQGKNTLTMHHTADQFQRSSDESTIADVRKVIERRVLIDDELLADPAYFYRLQNTVPSISAVDVQLREGRFLNETTKYHYDVWLYIGNPPEVVDPTVVIDWHAGFPNACIEQTLTEQPQAILQVRNILNARTAEDYSLIQLIDGLPDDTLLSEVRQKMRSEQTGLNPAILWEMGETYDFFAHVKWSTDGTDNLMDAVFIPRKLTRRIPKPTLDQADTLFVKELYRNPFAPTLTISQRQAWQQQLRKTLPDYMVPGEFVLLSRLPLTLNGKIDRKALPPVSRREAESHTVLTAPRTDIEKLVAEIWQESLRLDTISVFDNFFELGGHSLIAVQIMTRLEKETGKHLPLSMLFECPTVEKLALALQMDGKFIVWDSLVPIKPLGTKTPLYIIHGAGLHVMLFNTLAKNMDADQPIFGLQAKGINGVDEPLSSIEEIAAYYIMAIRAQNPDGPYALAGYSFGGIIAYEMCRQLKQMGKEVKVLAMFDTHADQSNYLDPWISKVWGNVQIGLKKYLYTFVLLKKDISGTISYKKGSIKRRVTTMYSKLKYTANYHKVFYGNQHKVHKSNQQATRNYRLTPQHVTVDLFRAEKRMYYIQDFEFLGWKPFALEGVTVHKVPGDHVSLFNPPNDKEFALALQNLLNSKL
ncbi:amino acid adenylation domain-containing protein [Spirosoma lituiforme]